MRDFYKCEKCGKIVKVIQDGKGSLVCCGEPMQKLAGFGSVDAILDFAMEKEQEAHDFYHGLAEEVATDWVKDMLEGFAKEELGHKAKLSGVRDGKALTPSPTQVADLKISDYLVEVPPRPDMDSQDALMVAMQREKASFKLYNDLASLAPSDDLRSTFLALAQEEAKHKLRLESLYEDKVLTGY
jgi:desulfoferrodoxin-like iron-binding protein